MIDLIGKLVEVGSGDITYVGRLVEINENEIYLESESSGWIVVPTDMIAFVRELQ
ncbi:MAG: hypothetical protein HZB33_03150 [Nitrospirae bacterium]|nr:hypothetical protein [Nitrospirota bacterium]